MAFLSGHKKCPRGRNNCATRARHACQQMRVFCKSRFCKLSGTTRPMLARLYSIQGLPASAVLKTRLGNLNYKFPSASWVAYGAPMQSSSYAAIEKEPEFQLGEDIPIRIKNIPLYDEQKEPLQDLEVLIADCDAVMQMYIDAGMGDRDPYWTEVWPSSVAMATELLRRPELVKGKRVADLGCGLGVGGIAAGIAGASEVVFLDREPLALQLALINASMNGFDILQSENEKLCSCSFEDFEENLRMKSDIDRVVRTLQKQGIDFQVAHTEGMNNSARQSKNESAKGLACVFDWNQAVTLSGFDIILACDVLYETFSVEPVANVVPQLLASAIHRPHPKPDLEHSSPYNPGVLLADPPLRARHNRERFLSLLSEQGFIMEESGQTSVFLGSLETNPAKRNVDIEFCILRRGEYGDTIGVKNLT